MANPDIVVILDPQVDVLETPAEQGPPGPTAVPSLSVKAGENLLAGDFVNLYNDAGFVKIRKATAATLGYEATGWIGADTLSGNWATMYFSYINPFQTSISPGPVFLSTTPGQATATAPSGSTQVVQRIGYALGATGISFQFSEPILLA